MTEAEIEARIWAGRVAAFYRQRVAIGVEETAELAAAIAGALTSTRKILAASRRWPGVINAAIDAWEAGRPSAGPRVAYLDHERGHISSRD